MGFGGAPARPHLPVSIPKLRLPTNPRLREGLPKPRLPGGLLKGPRGMPFQVRAARMPTHSALVRGLGAGGMKRRPIPQAEQLKARSAGGRPRESPLKKATVRLGRKAKIHVPFGFAASKEGLRGGRRFVPSRSALVRRKSLAHPPARVPPRGLELRGVGHRLTLGAKQLGSRSGHTLPAKLTSKPQLKNMARKKVTRGAVPQRPRNVPTAPKKSALIRGTRTPSGTLPFNHGRFSTLAGVLRPSTLARGVGGIKKRV